MELTITEHIRRVTVVAPQQRIDVFSASELQAACDRLLAAGATHFVIDLSCVPFMDSAGMAVLVRLLKRARQLTGDVVLVWPKEEASRRIINLTKFDRIFPMAETQQDALIQLS